MDFIANLPSLWAPTLEPPSLDDLAALERLEWHLDPAQPENPGALRSHVLALLGIVLRNMDPPVFSEGLVFAESIGRVIGRDVVTTYEGEIAEPFRPLALAVAQAVRALWQVDGGPAA